MWVCLGSLFHLVKSPLERSKTQNPKPTFASNKHKALLDKPKPAQALNLGGYIDSVYAIDEKRDIGC